MTVELNDATPPWHIGLVAADIVTGVPRIAVDWGLAIQRGEFTEADNFFSTINKPFSGDGFSVKSNKK